MVHYLVNHLVNYRPPYFVWKKEMNTVNKKKDLIYHYAIQGYYASEIRSFKDIDCVKSYVSKILNQLEIEGYIEPIKKTYKKQKKFVRYRKTEKIYPVKFTKSVSGGSNFAIERPRLNMISVKFEFIKFPKNRIDGKSFFLNKTRIIDYKHVFPDETINFRLIGNKWLVVFIPEHLVSADHFRNTKDYLYKRANKYAYWFMDYFDCVVGDPSIYQDFEIAVKENDPYLSELARKHGMLKLVDSNNNVVSWYDFSKGYCEFESRNEDIAEIKAFMPMIVSDLQSRVLSMQNDIESHNSILDYLNNRINDLENILLEIRDVMSSKSVKEDEKKDVT